MMMPVIAYGYGFKQPYNEENIIDFIKSHKNTFCRTEEEVSLFNAMLEYTAEEYDLEDFFCGYRCENSGMEGLGAVISNIMSRETGIRFFYQAGDSDCNSDAAIILPDKSPWAYNDIEKQQTEESLSAILNQYINELGADIESEYLAIEYMV